MSSHIRDSLYMQIMCCTRVSVVTCRVQMYTRVTLIANHGWYTSFQCWYPRISTFDIKNTNTLLSSNLLQQISVSGSIQMSKWPLSLKGLLAAHCGGYLESSHVPYMIASGNHKRDWPNTFLCIAWNMLGSNANSQSRVSSVKVCAWWLLNEKYENA